MEENKEISILPYFAPQPVNFGREKEKLEISIVSSDVFRGKINDAKVNLKSFQQPGTALHC